MKTVLITCLFIFQALLPASSGGDAAVRPVTVIGLRDTPYEVPWDTKLTLMRAIELYGGLRFPGSPGTAQVLRMLPDGTESKTIYNLRRLAKGRPLDDPKLQPGDHITFPQPKPINF